MSLVKLPRVINYHFMVCVVLISKSPLEIIHINALTSHVLSISGYKFNVLFIEFFCLHMVVSFEI